MKTLAKIRIEQIGTCVNERPDRNSFKCSECGAAWYGIGGLIASARPYFKYCPNCGRRIVEVKA